MTITMGIFEREEAVLEGVRLLREAGLKQSEIRIIVGNLEGAPLIASNADVPIEELNAIQETRRATEEGSLPLGAVPLSTAYPAGNAVTGAGPGGGVVFTGILDEDGPSRAEVLSDIGIPSSAIKSCGIAIESGHYILVADANSPNMEAALRSAGANIVAE
jgi:hypothetical protein